MTNQHLPSGSTQASQGASRMQARVASAGLWMRLGIGWQLSIGFVAVAILALTVNVLLQGDRTAVRTRTERVMPDLSALPALAAEPDSQASSIGTPTAATTAAAASIEAGASPNNSRTKGPAARGASAVLPAAPNPEALLSALDAFRKNVRSIAGASNPDASGPFDNGEAAQFAVDAAVERFMRQPAAARVDAAALQQFRTLLPAHQFTGREIARGAARRREILQTYATRLSAIDTLAKQPLDDSVKVFGRIFARDSVIAINQSVDGLRLAFNELVIAAPAPAAAIEAMQRAETAFDVTVNEQSSSLARALGADWVPRLRAAMTDLQASRYALTRLDLAQLQNLALLDAQSAEVVASVRAAAGQLARKRAAVAAANRSRQQAAGAAASTTVKPAPVAAPPELPLVRTVTERITTESATSYSLLWITGGVLLLLLVTSLGTVLSITVPVRRLTEATHRLARGERDVEVPRGGAREIDALSVSFNDMSHQLERARAELEEQRSNLEFQVTERTRDLQHLAAHDPLTRLPNRRQLFRHIEAAIARAAADGGSVGVFFLDVDNFKTINDSLNHEFGDQVLQQASLRLSEAVAPDGFCARLGGDEFTVVHEGELTTARLGELAARLVSAFEIPLRVLDQNVKVTVSVGVSVYPEHARAPEGLLRAADTALYRAKESGRSRFVLFDSRMQEAAARTFSIEQGLHGAIERGEFRLHFQPTVRLDGAAPSAVEALLRWQATDGRLIPPGEFLPVAEQSGMIVQIGEWVMREAVRAAAAWHRGVWPDVRIAVNVSPRQLLDGRFVGFVADLLREYELPARCIEVELTETVLQTGPGTIDALRELRARGVSIALDDFGTGYSSLSSLEKLPLTRVKLDRGLVSEIDRSPRALAIAHAIIELCAGLGLDVTAEGVERPSQLALLMQERPMTIQGYLISRPLPEVEWLQLLPLLPALMEELTLTLPSVDADADTARLPTLRPAPPKALRRGQRGESWSIVACAARARRAGLKCPHEAQHRDRRGRSRHP